MLRDSIQGSGISITFLSEKLGLSRESLYNNLTRGAKRKQTPSK